MTRRLPKAVGLNKPTNTERRKHPRYKCNVPILVAYHTRLEHPEGWEFQEVELKNFSASGLAFWCESRLPTDQVVVILGKKPAYSLVSAEVRIVSPALQAGVSGFIVGCELTGRVSLSDASVLDHHSLR